jgi:hypothetical protein
LPRGDSKFNLTSDPIFKGAKSEILDGGGGKSEVLMLFSLIREERGIRSGVRSSRVLSTIERRRLRVGGFLEKFFPMRETLEMVVRGGERW